MSPDVLAQYLKVMRDAGLMSFRLNVEGLDMTAAFGPDMPAQDMEPERAPGGWKTEPSDPTDPDPLQLGPLDAPIAFEDPEVTL
jgi:hypothetical protein